MSKLCPILPIGPTIPSFYLDNNNLEHDKTYGLDLYDSQTSGSDTTTEGLDSKPHRSVVYVSFGTLASLDSEQMKEITWAVRQSTYNFLIVVRPAEKPKLPEDFMVSNDNKYLLVDWCHQLEALAHIATGCFVAHGGWNSILEALCLGVPMVVFPQWTNQPTDAKLVGDVWKLGFRPKVNNDGIVRREEIVMCITEVMEGEKSEEIKANAVNWMDKAKKALASGGSSHRNIDSFLTKCVGFQ